MLFLSIKFSTDNGNPYISGPTPWTKFSSTAMLWNCTVWPCTHTSPRRADVLDWGGYYCEILLHVVCIRLVNDNLTRSASVLNLVCRPYTKFKFIIKVNL